jgi:hypothetical protein
VESRAGCHCAALAHHALSLTPLASCRLSFYLYNTLDEVDRATDAVAAIAAARTAPHQRLSAPAWTAVPRRTQPKAEAVHEVTANPHRWFSHGNATQRRHPRAIGLVSPSDRAQRGPD